jgi:DNA repair exonuclease SbcCD ATPase subunit
MLSETDSAALERLERNMGEGFRELKQMIGALDQRMRTIETTENGCRQVADLRIGSLETRVNDSERARLQEHNRINERIDKAIAERSQLIQALTDRVEWLEPWVKGLRWVVGIVGAAIIALIWGLITGTVTMTLP